MKGPEISDARKALGRLPARVRQIAPSICSGQVLPAIVISKAIVLARIRNELQQTHRAAFYR
jgi:hypothetical protein